MIKIYTKEYKGMLEDVFENNQLFLRTFGGNLQVVDGVTHNDNFLTLKVSDTESTISEYSTDKDIAFNDGTGKSSRFGDRTEIISRDLTVPYEKTLTIHEGVDQVTVNDDFEGIVAERGRVNAEKWTEYLNGFLAKALSENAGKTLEANELSLEGVTEAFNEANKEFINNRVSRRVGWVAYVTPDVYNLLVDNNLTTSAKGSTVNIDRNEVAMFKGFIVEPLADDYFSDGENILFSADNVGVAGIGLQEFRVMDSEDFLGKAIQSVGKYAGYIPEKNKKAILKAGLEPLVTA